MGITRGVVDFEFMRWGTRFLPYSIGRRAAAKRGLWVVLLGPDGAGKTSVIEEIGCGAAAGFAGCERFHLRPAMFTTARPVTNCEPHARPARGTLISFLKLGYLLAANWLGYLAVVRPRVRQGMLVLFDRYFTDYLVDPKRYRIPDSCSGLTKLIGKLVPRPDLYLVLDVPAHVLHQRKREVTADEAERQGRDYNRLAARLTNAAVVSAAGPLTAVLDEVLERIIDRRLSCYWKHFNTT